MSRSNWQPTIQDWLDMDEEKHGNRSTSHLRVSSSSRPSKTPSPVHMQTSRTGSFGSLQIPSPVSSRAGNSADDALSNASIDSFDWVGDGQVANVFEEEELEESILEEIGETKTDKSIMNSRGEGAMKHALVEFLGKVAVLAFYLTLLVFFGQLVFRISYPIVFGIAAEKWALYAFSMIFTPIWTHNALTSFIGLMSNTRIFSKSDYPHRLDSVKGSLTLSVSCSILGLIWYLHMLPLLTLTTVGTLFLKLLIFLATAGMVISFNSLLMVMVRSQFQERSFKNRIIESRFKVHIVDQLFLEAKKERKSRRGNDPTRSHSGSSVKEEKQRPQQRIFRPIIFNLPLLLPLKLYYWIKCIGSHAKKEYKGPCSDLDSGFSGFKEQLQETMKISGYEHALQTIPRSDKEAKLMARMIFHYLCREREREVLTPDDFLHISPNPGICREAYFIFDADGDGEITKAEFRAAMVKIFREQRNLMQSVANTGSALSILDKLSTIIAWAGLFFLCLALLGFKVLSLLSIFGSIFFGVNFIIYDAANKTFHALLLLFVVHPYDVGDRLLVGKGDAGFQEEDVLVVNAINIQNTVFRRWNGQMVSIPNHIIAAGSLTNLSRSPEQWERLEFSINAAGQDGNNRSVEDETQSLAEFRRRVEKFIQSYPQDYYPNFELRALIAADTAKAEQNLNIIKFILKIRCRETIDNQKKWVRHARILSFIKQSIPSSGASFSPSG